MTSYVPPKKNDAAGWIGYVSLEPRVATGAFQTNPTLATGDVKISIDGGALTNLGTLPVVTPASSKLVKITLSQAETNGDNLAILFSDAAGGEWTDLLISLQTTARGIDDLAFPTTSGRSLDVTATGAAGIDWANVESPTTVLGLSGTTVKTATDVETDTADIQTRLPAALVGGRMDSSVGAVVDGVLTAAKFAAGAFDAVWTVTARILTAGTNIVLAKGTGVTGFNDLSQADVRTAVGLAAANLDTQLSTIDDFIDTEVTAIKAKTDSLTFTVAGKVDSHITHVNSVPVGGAGTSGNPWGPA